MIPTYMNTCYLPTYYRYLPTYDTGIHPWIHELGHSSALRSGKGRDLDANSNAPVTSCSKRRYLLVLV